MFSVCEVLLCFVNSLSFAINVKFSLWINFRLCIVLVKLFTSRDLTFIYDKYILVFANLYYLLYFVVTFIAESVELFFVLCVFVKLFCCVSLSIFSVMYLCHTFLLCPDQTFLLCVFPKHFCCVSLSVFSVVCLCQTFSVLHLCQTFVLYIFVKVAWSDSPLLKSHFV